MLTIFKALRKRRDGLKKEVRRKEGARPCGLGLRVGWVGFPSAAPPPLYAVTITIVFVCFVCLFGCGTMKWNIGLLGQCHVRLGTGREGANQPTTTRIE